MGRGGARAGAGRGRRTVGRGARGGARCSARSSLARAAYRQSGAGCGDVNCIGVGRERSVGRDVSYSYVSSACSEPSRVIGALDLCFRRRRARSPLRGSPRAHRRIADPRIPEMVSAVEAPDRGLFTSAFEPPLSLSNLPPVSLRRFRTRLLLFCFVFQNVDTYDDGSGAGPAGRSCFC